MIRLNIGCGSGKIDGFVNVDINDKMKPDLVLDIRKEHLPYKEESVNQIVMFHTIEHIEKKYHSLILEEFHRVLQKEGEVIFSYPEFTRCYENWVYNRMGLREFWEATIYGRQSDESDFHVCIMNTPDFKYFLEQNAFEVVSTNMEKGADYNTILKCKPISKASYSDWLEAETDRYTFK